MNGLLCRSMTGLPRLQTPIFLAYGGRFQHPELVAAVADAGGVGSFGFAYSSPEAIDRLLWFAPRPQVD